MNNILAHLKSKKAIYIFACSIILVAVVYVSAFAYLYKPKNPITDPIDKIEPETSVEKAATLETFSSCDDLKNTLKDVNKGYSMDARVNQSSPESIRSGSSDQANKTADFSGTNNQVEGVDEGDIIKTDGEYIYTLNGRNINITQLNKADGNLKKISKIALASKFDSVSSLSLEKNILVVIGYKNESYGQSTTLNLFDILDKNNPKLIRELNIDGNNLVARVIGGRLFLVNNYNNYNLYPGYDVRPQNESLKSPTFEESLPKFYDSLSSKSELLLPCNQIKYIKPTPSFSFMEVVGVDLNNPKGSLSREVVLGSSQNVYLSNQNLYAATTMYQNRDVNTAIFKFALGEKVEYKAQGRVKGIVLNQFSMDEYKDTFRVATTVQQSYKPGVSIPILSTFIGSGPGSSTPSSSGIYTFDKDLKPLGSADNLAAGEDIYAVRFLNEKGYVVTFKKVDPLFSFDLSDPKNPKVTGQLKIPGYSNYLHPIDGNMLIGVGKNAVEAVDGFGDSTGFAWYQGLKIGLFDVSDLSNPKELSHVEIGDRGTDSLALQDHHAFLWDESRDLLSLPVDLKIIPDDVKNQPEDSKNRAISPYGEPKYQGSYVYKVSKDKGFELKGRISHQETKVSEVKTETVKKLDQFGQVIETPVVTNADLIDCNGNDKCFGGDASTSTSSPAFPGQPDQTTDYLYNIKRQFYIGEYLVTMSDKQLQSNKIEDLKLVNNIGF